MAGRASYPWDSWTDGSPHTIRRGVEFTCKRESLRVQLHQHASKRGMRVRTRLVGDDRITFRFWPAEEAPRSHPSLADLYARSLRAS